MHKKSKVYIKKGFTIVELAIVLVVIGIIMAMVVKGKQIVDSARDRAELAKIAKLEAATAIYNTYVHGNFLDMIEDKNSIGSTVVVGVAPLRIDHMASLNIINYEQLKSRYKMDIPSGTYSGKYDTYWMGMHCNKRSLSDGTYRWIATGPGYDADFGSRSICSMLIMEEPVPGIDYSETPISKRMVCIIENFLDDTDMDTGSGLKTSTSAPIPPRDLKDCSLLPDDLSTGVGYGYKLF